MRNIPDYEEFANESVVQKPRSAPKTDLEELAEELYQMSIDDLDERWEAARRTGNTDPLVRAMRTRYDRHQLVKEFARRHSTAPFAVWNSYSDAKGMTIWDYLTEWAEEGIS